MPNKKLILTLIPLACLVGFLFWWFSASQVLQRRSSALIDCVHMEPETSRMERAFKTEKLRDLLADTVTITYPSMETTFAHAMASNEPITLPKDRAKSALLYLTELAEWIKVSEQSVEVVNHDDSSAEVAVAFQLAAKLKGKPEQSAPLQGTFRFSYQQNRWLLRQADFQ